MKLFQPDMQQRRTLSAVFVITFTLAVLLTAFFHTQVLSGEQYALRSEENRLRPITIPSPRGNVVDRHGEIVATSIPGYSVMLLPGPEEQIRQTLRDLAPFLGLTPERVGRILVQRTRKPHDLISVSGDATYAQVAAIEERRASFPNLLITERPKRYYPAGPALGHLIGYVAEISKKELTVPQFAQAGYKQGRWIGKAGLEKEYEMLLSGEDGARFVEVDAMGRVVDPRSVAGYAPPIPGEDLKLTIDLGLQKYLHSIFPDTMKGAIAVMIPSTGEVLALYSHPTMDPNDFVGGIPSRLWTALQQDPKKPLLHRAVAALYPPASTWKLATAVIGLQKGIVKAETRMPIPCTGGMYYAGRYARCWYAPGHGSLDLVGAIEHSCNVYFYQVGIRLGLEELINAGVRMGFNSETGIDLPGEKDGEFPSGIDWYVKRFGHKPTPSEVMSLSIGQGPNAQTVLKMAHFYSATAGTGRAPQPHLALAGKDESEANALDLNLDEAGLKAIWSGLAGVTSWERGGTARLSALERWKLYGKTGTGQNPHGDDHGWFAGFAGPHNGAPEVAVAVIIEHGLHGSDVAPLAAKAAQYYLDKKHGLPFDPQPTLIERWESRRCTWGQACITNPLGTGGGQTRGATAPAQGQGQANQGEP